MRTIPLTQGKVALADDQDYVWLSQWKWHALKRVLKKRDAWYAVRCVRTPGGRVIAVYMHVEIAARMGIGQRHKVDHWDGDSLNNQRKNLRAATHAQNCQNRQKQPHSSKYKGVSWENKAGRWRAQIQVDGRCIFLGYFVREEDAARAYDRAARQYFGDFALLNFDGPL